MLPGFLRNRLDEEFMVAYGSVKSSVRSDDPLHFFLRIFRISNKILHAFHCISVPSVSLDGADSEPPSWDLDSLGLDWPG